VSDEDNWRLKVQLRDGAVERSRLDGLLGRIRHPDLARELGGDVPHDVAVTHDGSCLFAYAASEASLSAARAAIELAMRHAGATADISVSRWDTGLDEWLQTDPPLEGDRRRAEQAAERDEETVESRTLIVSAGKLVRSQVERTMREWAERLDLRCEVIEHPHLLTTQVAFTVTGPRRKLDEFGQGLRAEELATLRTERAVMLSPL
jgi:hypothetical protein